MDGGGLTTPPTGAPAAMRQETLKLLRLDPRARISGRYWRWRQTTLPVRVLACAKDVVCTVGLDKGNPGQTQAPATDCLAAESLGRLRTAIRLCAFIQGPGAGRLWPFPLS
jgi:hypothetical protein